MTAHPADSPTPPGHDLDLAHPAALDGAKLSEGLDRLADAVDEVIGRDEVSAEVLR